MASPNRQKRILVSWYTTPEYIPPFKLSDRQVTVGPRVETDQTTSFAGWTPDGEYDLKQALESQGIRESFDAIVVWGDAVGSNRPMNLSAFDCPRVLCVGDTQHLKRPLATMVAYAQAAGFDYIVSSHNRHHLHWFQEAGFANVAWIPGIKARHIPRPLRDGRKPQICFIGQWTVFHPRRLRCLQALEAAGLPLWTGRAPREESADLYASSVVSFNASLNGDLNLRVFEVLSAGGCLLTDRLSPQSGLDRILREERDLCAYGSSEELVDKAGFLLRNPSAALDLARNGNRTYTRNMLPRQQADVLLDWIFRGKLDPLYAIEPKPAWTSNAPSLKLRLAVYEALQEVHRHVERPRIFFAEDLPKVFHEDAADLYRCETTVASARDADPSWDCVIAPKGTPLAPGVQPKLMISI